MLTSASILTYAVIQELMQTDLHRVIRTQQLTDDHCQVSSLAAVSLCTACSLIVLNL